MKILLTGGAGYIGSNTLNTLINLNHDVEIIDNLSNNSNLNINIKSKFNNINLNDFDILNNFLANKKFDLVIHFAGSINVSESIENPKKYYENNYVASLNLLNSMIGNNIKKLIFSSSAAVYGNDFKNPIKESDFKKPISPYGKTKLMIEETLKDYDKSYDLKFITLRFFNSCGAQLDGSLGERHNPETHIIPLLMQVASGRLSKFNLFGNNYNTYDGTCIRDYVHVIDVVDAHIKSIDYLFKKNNSDIFNIGNNKGYSVNKLILETEKVTNKKIKYEVLEGREGDPSILISDNSKIKNLLKWSPNYSDLKTILKTAWLWENKIK